MLTPARHHGVELRVDGGCAARSGSIPMTEHMRRAGSVFDSGAYLSAALCGSLDTARWLACEAGVSAADLPLHEFLNPVLWPNDTAAHGRDLVEVVRLLVECAQCYYWDASVVVPCAVERGNLALVQYLLQQRPGHQVGANELEGAACAGCEALLEWLAGQPGFLDSPGNRPYTLAASNGDLATLRALRRLGVPWGARDSLAQAVERGCTGPTLRWLAEHAGRACGQPGKHGGGAGGRDAEGRLQLRRGSSAVA